MSTVNTFRIISSHASLTVKSVLIEDADLLDVNNANPLAMGEWMTFNASDRAVRAADPGVRPGPFVLSAEAGRSDTQGIGGRGKVPLIVLGTFIGETLIFNATAPVLGAILEVADITYDSLTKSGLQTHAGGATTPVIGHVIKTDTTNNGWMRFVYTAS
jgi:hypothetical protein